MKKKIVWLAPLGQQVLIPTGYGKQKCDPGFSVEVPRPYWMLHFVISGKGTLTNERGTFEVLPSQMFVVHPHRIHSYKADENDPWEYMWVNFECNFPLPALLEQDIITIPAAGSIFSDIVAVNHNEAGEREYICGKIWELISLLLRLEHKHLVKQNPYVDAAKEFIAANYSNEIMVSDIAESLSLDRTYFSTVFSAETGTSPKQYLTKFRLEKAAELLVSGSSVAEAAFSCGYMDAVNFSRMFKRHFGVSPMHYREKLFLEEKEYKEKVGKGES